MRALVTGPTEFLGRRLVRQLNVLGHEPVMLVRNGSERSSVDTVADAVVCDITDRASLAAAVGTVDVVFHTAIDNEAGPNEQADHHGAEVGRVDVDGSRNVFDAAAHAGVTVVHASSVTAYGPTGPDPQTETYWSEAEPASALERTRREAHLLARECQRSGVDVRIAAAGMLYGPDDPSALGRLTKWYMTVPVPVIPLRDAIWSPVNVDDCADGLIRIAEDGLPGDEYLLAAETVSAREWIETVAAVVDKPAPLAHIPEGIVARASRFIEWGVHAAGGPHELIAEYVAAATRSYAYSGAKARRELGWNPRPLDVGLAQVAAAYGRAPA